MTYSVSGLLLNAGTRHLLDFQTDRSWFYGGAYGGMSLNMVSCTSLKDSYPIQVAGRTTLHSTIQLMSIIRQRTWLDAKVQPRTLTARTLLTWKPPLLIGLPISSQFLIDCKSLQPPCTTRVA